MTVNLRIPLWGLDGDKRKRWALLIGCLLIVTAGIYLVRPFTETVGNSEFTPSDSVDGLLWMIALIGGPLLVSAANAYMGGGLIDSLAVGIVPGISFVGVIPIAKALGTGGNGDIALWLLIVIFAAIGVAGALIGFAIGTIGRSTVRLLS